MIKKLISSIVSVGLILTATGIVNPFVATAAGSISQATDTMSRLKASTASDHTFMFVLPSGVASGGNLTLTFSAGFTGVSSMVSNDFDVAENSGSTCSAGSWTEKSVKGSPSTTDFSAIGSGQVVTILSGGASATLTAGRCIRIKAGLNATDSTGSGSPTHQISNGASGANDTITIGSTLGDVGTISVDIMDDDQVSVSATVNQTMSFDLDVGTSVGENGTPYQVPLGTLSASAVTVSNGSIKTIYADGGTNSSGGMNVSVRNANGANGLVSTSVNTDKIPSATGTMAVGTANYGLCVGTANLSGFAKSTGYNTTCAVGSGTNGVVGLTSTSADILTSSSPVASGHADIVVNAEISTATPAHADYTDTLTFIATASF